MLCSLKKVTDACRRPFHHSKSRRSCFNRVLYSRLAALGYFNCCYNLPFLRREGKLQHQTGHLEWSPELSKNSNVNDLFSGRGGVLTVL